MDAERTVRSVITFFPSELEILQREADEALALRKRAGLGVESYQEKRLAFALELNRGGVFDTVKTRRYAKRIKTELAAKRRKSRKGKDDRAGSNNA